MTLREKGMEIAKTFELDVDETGRVTDRGKFEGLRVEFLPFVDEALNGFATRLDDERDVFKLTKDESEEIGGNVEACLIYYHYDGSIIGHFLPMTIEQVTKEIDEVNE